MKKVLVVLINYHWSSFEHLKKCLNAYMEFTEYDLTIHILMPDDYALCSYTSGDLSEYSKLNIIKHYRPRDLGVWFEHEFKAIFWDNRNDYDYYIFSEDDVLITKENFNKFVETQNELKFPYVCGFMRYELLPNDDYKYLFDQHPTHSIHRNLKGVAEHHIINGKAYISPNNVHQSCHIITKEMMKHLVDNHKHYFEKVFHHPAGILEATASDIYYSCDFVKVLPVDGIEKLCVHHLANKYVNISPHVYNRGSTPNEVKMVDKNFKTTFVTKVMIYLMHFRLKFLKNVDISWIIKSMVWTTKLFKRS